MLVSYCSNLQRLNLLGIPVIAVENRVQLWKILTGLRLTYLVIEACVLPCKEDFQTAQGIIAVYQKFSGLRALELFHADEWSCIEYDDVFEGELLLPFFPSLVRLIVTSNHYSQSALRELIISCKTLKCIQITTVYLFSMHITAI